MFGLSFVLLISDMDLASSTIISDEIKALIRFLAHVGASIMKGHKKFTVTPAILRQINDLLEMMREDIFVSPLTNRDLICKFVKNDLMFLYDFVKKTPNLKISNTVSSHEIIVDVQDFSNLNYLELYKFNVKRIRNVEFLRERLEAVVCVRSLENVGDLLLSRSGLEDKIWTLKHAIFSRNSISTLDQSFIYTPYLQYLDLSYNHLTDLRQLTCLLNLTYLNASYNNLKEAPKLLLFKLKTLLLSNNYITDITGKFILYVYYLGGSDDLSHVRTPRVYDLKGRPRAFVPLRTPLTAKLPTQNKINLFVARFHAKISYKFSDRFLK